MPINACLAEGSELVKADSDPMFRRNSAFKKDRLVWDKGQKRLDADVQ